MNGVKMVARRTTSFVVVAEIRLALEDKEWAEHNKMSMREDDRRVRSLKVFHNPW